MTFKTIGMKSKGSKSHLVNMKSVDSRSHLLANLIVINNVTHSFRHNTVMREA